MARPLAARFARLLVGADAVFGDHFDAVLDEVGVEGGDLLLGHLDLLEGRGDLLEGQVAALAAQGDQAAQLLGLRERLVRRILIQPLVTDSNGSISLPPVKPFPLPRGADPNASATGKYREITTLHWAMASDTTTVPASAPDVQAGVPATQVGLSRVGVTGVEKVIRVKSEDAEGLYHADFECFVDLNPRQAGVHMSRFEEIVGEAIDEVVLGEAFKAEVLAAHIAQRVRERQGGLRAEVSVTARYPQTVTTPESGQKTQEIYVLFGTAVDSEHGTRTLTGVQAQGMTACPCAQEMVAGLGRERLAEQGFSPEEVERVIEAVPIATHNQRGIGTLHIGCPEGGEAWIDAPELLRIVESSMSSEIYELMKRPDEMSVVVKAHENPRFVEDCVREMIRQVVEGYPDLPDEAFVMARQENLETIHRHNVVVAERYGTLGDLRAELAGGEHQAAPDDAARVAGGA